MGEQNLELVKPNDAKKTNVESLWLKWAGSLRCLIAKFKCASLSIWRTFHFC